MKIVFKMNEKFNNPYMGLLNMGEKLHQSVKMKFIIPSRFY